MKNYGTTDSCKCAATFRVQLTLNRCGADLPMLCTSATHIEQLSENDEI